MPLLLPATAVTLLVLLFLDLTEAYDPPGSAVAWLLIIPLLAVHLLLLRRQPRLHAPAPTTTSIRAASIIAILLIALFTTISVLRFHNSIFHQAVIPRANAQLGLVTQVLARIGTNDLLYGYTYPRAGYTELNPFPIGLVIPYGFARALGLDWRYAPLAATALLGALLIAAVVILARRFPHSGLTEHHNFALVLIAAGAAAFMLPRTTEFFQWGHTIVLWPLIAAFALAVSHRLHLLTALLAGILAAMNPGWLLMLPLVAGLLASESRRAIPPAILLLAIPPLLAYAPFRAEFSPLLEGISGSAFAEGLKQAAAGSARFPSIHALGDFLGLRLPIYLLALAAIITLAIRIARSHDRLSRLSLLALGAFIIIAAAPATYFFQWTAHLILLAGLVPGAMLAAPEDQPPPDAPPRPWEFALVPLATILFLAPASIQLARGIDGTINRAPGFAQRVDRNLLDGFNVRSEDHAWGRQPHMVVGFTLDQLRPGILEIHLGTLGGDFTPLNPTNIRINGRLKGAYIDLPGDYGYARVPIDIHDVHIGFNIVELDARWARTPRSLNISDDPRLLSISYLGMRFLPQPKENPTPHANASTPRLTLTGFASPFPGTAERLLGTAPSPLTPHP